MAELIEAAVRRLQADGAGPAEQWCRARLEANPGSADDWFTLAFVQSQQGRLAPAIASLRQVVCCEPGGANSWSMLAELLRQSGQPDEALEAIATAAGLAPERYEIQVNLASLALKRARDDLAGDAVEALRARWPERRESRLLAAEWRKLRADFEPAERLLESLLRDDPDDARAIGQLGVVRLLAADAPGVASAFARAIDLEPGEPEHFGNLAAAGAKGADPAPILDRLRRARRDSRTPADVRIGVEFGLAVLHDALAAYPEAFPHAITANRMVRAGLPYDAEALEREDGEIRSRFTRAEIERLSAGSTRGEDVVLIVGMPRSGSTLVDQTLGRHSRVHPYGELETLGRIANSLAAKGWRASLEELAADGGAKVAAAYLHAFWARGREECVAVDKMPSNFRLLGLANAIAPRARIIHVRRDPRDVAVSLFFQQFEDPNAFSYGLDSIAHYYREYTVFMAHWRQHLSSRMLTVDYERMVGDFEAETRRMLDFLGLPFEDACLHPERASRVVRTASILQVRDKVSPRSVARWRNCENLLPREILELVAPPA